MKVMIRIPTNDSCHRNLAEWLVWWGRQRPDDSIAFTFTYGFGVAEGRNMIAEAFRQDADYDALLMLDSDCVPPYSTAILEGLDRYPIVCGPYCGFGQYKPIVWHVYDEEMKPLDRKSWPKDRWFKVGAAGTGCMAMTREFVEQLPKNPWIWDYDEEGTLIGGEDILFCKRVGGVWLDAHYSVRHYKEIEATEIKVKVDELLKGGNR